MNKRLKLHNLLCNILVCPTSGENCKVYFQPPQTVKMKYPAIVYTISDIKNNFANDTVYKQSHLYSITVIDKNPDSTIADTISKLPTSKFERSYASDNLNHFVFTLFF